MTLPGWPEDLLLVVHHAAARRHLVSREIVEQWHADRGIRRPGGYHFEIYQPAGADSLSVHAARPLDFTAPWSERHWGAHALGVNHRSVGILLGYHGEHEGLPDPMWAAAVALLTHLCLRLDRVPALHIRGHREVGSTPTLCPGRNTDLARLRLDVSASMAAARATSHLIAPAA